MTRRLRVRGKYRPLDEDQVALAFLMLARQLREEARQAEPKRSRKVRRVA